LPSFYEYILIIAFDQEEFWLKMNITCELLAIWRLSQHQSIANTLLWCPLRTRLAFNWKFEIISSFCATTCTLKWMSFQSIIFDLS
jgi:hypothetical protein